MKYYEVQKYFIHIFYYLSSTVLIVSKFCTLVSCLDIMRCSSSQQNRIQVFTIFSCIFPFLLYTHRPLFSMQRREKENIVYPLIFTTIVWKNFQKNTTLLYFLSWWHLWCRVWCHFLSHFAILVSPKIFCCAGSRRGGEHFYSLLFSICLWFPRWEKSSIASLKNNFPTQPQLSRKKGKFYLEKRKKYGTI